MLLRHEMHIICLIPFYKTNKKQIKRYRKTILHYCNTNEFFLDFILS